MDYPKVTYGTLSYNTGKFVVKTLESIKMQGYDNYQHIIIDDCSTDDSVKLIQEWIDKNDYKCTFIARDKNKGIHAGVNEILSLAEGKYLALASDDLWVPSKTFEQVAMLEAAGPEYGVAYGNMSYIDEEGRPKGDSNWFDDKFCKNYAIPQGDVFKDVIYSVTFFIQASLYNLEVLRKHNFRFDERFITEDWYLNLFVARHSKAIGTYDVCCKYRYRNDSITSTNWTDEKMHRVLMSQLAMFDHVYNFPQNTAEDKLAIYKKMHTLALQLYASAKLSKLKKSAVAFNLFQKQPSFKNIMKALVLLVAGNLNMANKTVTSAIKDR